MASQYHNSEGANLSGKTATNNATKTAMTGRIKKSAQSGKIQSSGKAAKAAKELDFGYMGSREERADTRTIASRKRLHDQMNSEIEAFLAHGGEINQVEPHVTADPPKRPVSHYGQRPI